MVTLTLACMLLQSSAERLLEEAAAESREALRQVQWLEGRWEGTVTVDGEEARKELSVESILRGTHLYIYARTRCDSGETIEEGGILTYDAEAGRYVLYHFLPGYSSRTTVDVADGGRVIRWRDASPSPLGQFRGELRQSGSGEMTDEIEELDDGEWREVMFARMRRR